MCKPLPANICTSWRVRSAARRPEVALNAHGYAHSFVHRLACNELPSRHIIPGDRFDSIALPSPADRHHGESFVRHQNAARADQLDDIKKKGEIVFGALGTDEPNSFVDLKSREIVGSLVLSAQNGQWFRGVVLAGVVAS